MRIFQRFSFLVAVLVLTGCAAYPPVPQAPAASESAQPTSTASALAGSAWTASYVDGVGATRGNWPQLRWLAADRVAGSGGCNNFSGGVVQAEDGVRFGSLAATGKLCMTEPGGQEDKFFRALELTRQLRVEGTQLLLLDASGKTLAKLERLN